MITRLVLFGTAAVAAVGLLAMPAADASVPTPVTFHESVVFGTDHPPVGAFTADGLPQCASGSFRDHLNNFNFGGHTLVVDRIYTCDGGSQFLARMVLHTQPADADGVATVDGEWTILKGTGDMAAVQGAGTTAAVNSGCTPDGRCEAGVSTVVASVH
jgi:hypothetical protein